MRTSYLETQAIFDATAHFVHERPREIEISQFGLNWVLAGSCGVLWGTAVTPDRNLWLEVALKILEGADSRAAGRYAPRFHARDGRMAAAARWGCARSGLPFSRKRSMSAEDTGCFSTLGPSCSRARRSS